MLMKKKESIKNKKVMYVFNENKKQGLLFDDGSVAVEALYDKFFTMIDGRNRLISKQVNGVTEYRLIYAGQLSPVAKVDGSGNTLETYIKVGVMAQHLHIKLWFKSTLTP